MSRSRWGREGPPPEAYSRVTNPERFEPLIPVVQKIVDQLEKTYDVERTEGYGLDEELERNSELARPTISLRPRSEQAAPITVVFTTFPSVMVRFGKWNREWFPSCGCDACDEDVEGEIESFTESVQNATRCGLEEVVRNPQSPKRPKPPLTWRLRFPWRRGSDEGRWGWAGNLSESQLRSMRRSGIPRWWLPRFRREKKIKWGPWPLRK